MLLSPPKMGPAAQRWVAAAAAAAGDSAGRRPLTERKQRVDRPSKTAAKEEAHRYLDIAKLMVSNLTDKQTLRLEPLVGTRAVEELAVARRIRRTTGGRGRQQNLVARLLRESVLEEQVEELEAAVHALMQGQGFVANPGAARRAELWLEALLEGEAGAQSEVVQLARAAGLDGQRMLQLARQAQRQPASAGLGSEASGLDGSSSGSGASRGSLPSDAAAQQQHQQQEKTAAKARKQLRGLLVELAEAIDALEQGGAVT